MCICTVLWIKKKKNLKVDQISSYKILVNMFAKSPYILNGKSVHVQGVTSRLINTGECWEEAWIPGVWTAEEQRIRSECRNQSELWGMTLAGWFMCSFWSVTFKQTSEFKGGWEGCEITGVPPSWAPVSSHGNANSYSHYGEQGGDSLKNWK